MKMNVRALLVGSLVCLATFVVRAQGVTDKEVVLGQSIYLTGGLAELGKDFTSGAAAYFSRVNAGGGVNGRSIRVVTLDDAYDPSRALANVEELERQGVFALWQFAGTGTVREVAAVAAAKQIPLVAAIATGPKLRTEHSPFTFYVRAGNTEELQSIVDHLVATGTKRVSAVYVDAPYGIEGYDALKSILTAKNVVSDTPSASGGSQAAPAHRRESLDLVATATIKANGDGSEAAAKELMKGNPQAVVMITTPSSSKQFVLASRKVKLHATLYSLNAGVPIGTVKELGDAANGVVVCQVMPNVDRAAIPIVREYRRDYAAAGHTKFTSASLEGYINARIMVEALQRTGRALTREALVKSLESLTTLDLGGFVVHYSRTKHAGSKAVELSIVRVSSDGERFIY